MAVIAESQIWKDLIAKGASSTQAAGIMGNMQWESSFDPEAIGDQGTSFGLVQEHGNYQFLVTGKSSADEQKQLKLLKQQGGFADASGSNAAQAAGNFAVNFERCRNCQFGTSEVNRRQASAQQIFNDAQKGQWPQSKSGSGNQSQVGGNQSAQTASATSCSWIEWLNPLTLPECIARGAVGSLNPVTALETVFGNTIKDILVRLGLILLGGIIIVVGIIVLVKTDSDSGSKDMAAALKDIVSKESAAKDTAKTTAVAETAEVAPVAAV